MVTHSTSIHVPMLIGILAAYRSEVPRSKYRGSDDYVFAIQTIEDSGEAQLVHTTCGGSGFPASSAEKMKRLTAQLGNVS